MSKLSRRTQESAAQTEVRPFKGLARLQPHAAGADIGAHEIVVCIPGPDETQIVRTFGTYTADLESLTAWLTEQHTGDYWKPVFNLLEDDFEVQLVNAQHVKHVPGRKTDVCDAEWLAELLLHGLLTPSFIPPKPQRALRDLTRYRTKLVQERTRLVNRVQKLLEGGNIKLASVATDVMGVSAWAMLEEIAAGQTDVRERRSVDVGGSSRAADTIPGVDRKIAEDMLAEMGLDMSQYPTDKHLTSWAGPAPGNRESGGKRYWGRTRRGNRTLSSVMVQAAWSATRTLDTFLKARYHRLAARRGKKRAIVATANLMLTSAWHMLTYRQLYRELGGDYFAASQGGQGELPHPPIGEADRWGSSNRASGGRRLSTVYFRGSH